MALLVRGEYGITLYVDANFSLLGNTGLSLTGRRPDGSTFTVTPTLGTSTIVVDGVTLTANEYVFYSVQSTNFPVEGAYEVQLQIDFTASQRRKTPAALLEVVR